MPRFELTVRRRPSKAEGGNEVHGGDETATQPPAPVLQCQDAPAQNGAQFELDGTTGAEAASHPLQCQDAVAQNGAQLELSRKPREETGPLSPLAD